MISLAKYSDPAPALGRVLRLLALLGDGTERTLEELAVSARLPKPSCLRLLRSLALAGTARQGADRRWRALARVQPIGGDGTLDERLGGVMDGLAERSGRIAECWLPEDGALRLDRRVEPAGCEVTIKAGIGFRRGPEEIEAVVQVAMAWGWLRRGRRHWHWWRGRPAAVGPRWIDALLAEARAAGWAISPDANCNGVRRVAAPVLEGQRLVAVLSLAVIGRLAAGEERALCTAIAAAARTLSRP